MECRGCVKPRLDSEQPSAEAGPFESGRAGERETLQEDVGNGQVEDHSLAVCNPEMGRANRREREEVGWSLARTVFYTTRDLGIGRTAWRIGVSQ